MPETELAAGAVPADVKTSESHKVRDWITANAILVVLAVLVLGIALMDPAFVSILNLRNILNFSSTRLIIALGAGIVLIARGVDLSAGRMVGLAAVVSASMLQTESYSRKFYPGLPELPVWLPILIAVAICALVGMVNGLIIAKLGVPPFIATLGMMVIVYGANAIYFDSEPNNSQPIGGMRSDFTALGTGSIGSGDWAIPYIVIIAATTALIFWFTLNKTVFGKQVYALGGNPHAAQVAGARKMVRLARSKSTWAPRRRRKSLSSSIVGFRHGAADSTGIGAPDPMYLLVTLTQGVKCNVPTTSRELIKMKTRHSWVLALALAFPVLASAADPPAAAQATAASERDYSYIDIRELIERVARRTGKLFILDSRVRADVPLTGLDVAKVDYAVLLAIFKVHQFAAYESNGVVKVVPDVSARQLPIPLTTGISSKTLDDEYVMVMFQAKNMCAAHAVPVLRPLMPQHAHLAAFPQSNTLLIADHAANARRIIAMAERLDKSAPSGQQCAPEMWPPARNDGK